MAKLNFLDKTGLSQFWNKIKEYINNHFGVGAYSNNGKLKIEKNMNLIMSETPDATEIDGPNELTYQFYIKDIHGLGVLAAPKEPPAEILEQMVESNHGRPIDTDGLLTNIEVYNKTNNDIIVVFLVRSSATTSSDGYTLTSTFKKLASGDGWGVTADPNDPLFAFW